MFSDEILKLLNQTDNITLHLVDDGNDIPVNAAVEDVYYDKTRDMFYLYDETSLTPIDKLALMQRIITQKALDNTSIKYRRNHIYNVDGSRTDNYVADGSPARPYKTVLAAQTAINALANVQIALATQAAWDTTRYIVKIAAGIYTDNITITNMKYLRYDMEGATISGNITIATTMIGGAVSDYYGKVEFKGGNANRAYRGRCGLISGNIILTRNNDSLMYLAFVGVEVSGNMSVGTAAAASDGTWVICLENAYFSGSAKFISAYVTGATSNILLETYGYNKIVAHLAKQDGSECNIQLYDCNNTYFDLINITPIENGVVKNCTFNSTTTIVAAKTLAIDANSSLSLFAQSPTLTGITLNAIDGILATAGTVATRAAARALVGDGAAIGTILKAGGAATTKPNLYVKVLNVPGDTDWERIVTQASD